MSALPDKTETKSLDAECAEMFEWLEVPLVLCEEDGRIVFANASAETLYCKQPGEMIGQFLAQAQGWNSPLLFEEAFRKTEREGRWQGLAKQTTGRGVELLIESRFRMWSSHSGDSYLLVASYDRTPDENVEEQILRNQRMDTLGSLVAGVSHDLRNVLTPIVLATNVLEMMLEDDEMLELVATIEAASRRGVNLVQQLLWFYRGSEGERTTVDPAALVKDLRRILHDSFPKSIRARFLTPPSVGMVWGNPTQLHQLLLNLCVNARDAMPEGGRLEIRVDDVLRDCGESSPDRPFVKFTVQDTGCGIPAEDQERIFETLFTTKTSGTGLGLATVAHIVERHGGSIELESKPGEGSRFEVYLPASETELDGTAMPSSEEVLPGKGERILVAEDDPALRLLMEEVLRGNGFEVETATDGQQALRLLERSPSAIDLLATDLNMPELTGGDLIAELSRVAPSVKVLAISALPSEMRMREIDGSVPFLQKPFDVRTLLSSIRALLDERAPGPATQCGSPCAEADDSTSENVPVS